VWLALTSSTEPTSPGQTVVMRLHAHFVLQKRVRTWQSPHHRGKGSHYG